jgi:hypothetical protein
MRSGEFGYVRVALWRDIMFRKMLKSGFFLQLKKLMISCIGASTDATSSVRVIDL